MATAWRRRHAAPLDLPRPRIDVAVPLRGLGRMPHRVGDDLCLLTYVDAAKTYDYRRVGLDGTVRWQQSYPSGGYSAVAYNERTNRICGPTGYFGYVEVDWETGAEIQRFDLGIRVRSSPVAVGDGFMATAGNRVYRFGGGQDAVHSTSPGHVFFGQPVLHADSLLTAGVERDGDDTFTVMSAFGLDELSPRWSVRLAAASMPSADSSGLELHNGVVYINLPGPATAAVDATNGSILWHTELPIDDRISVVYRSRPTVVAPAQEDPYLVVTSLQGEVFCLSAVTGEMLWKRTPDRSAGIWSPALAMNGELVVHSGVFLIGLSARDGDVLWSTPIGFDAYTIPLDVGGRIAVCAGDPPNDGYLVVVDPQRFAESREVHSVYQQGDVRDHLSITVSGLMTSDVTVDLRMFGRSGHEKLRADLSGTLEWRGDVQPGKRLGESVVLATIRTEGREEILPVYVDAGASTEPTEPSAMALDVDQLPLPQSSRTDSGGMVLAAVAGRLGHPLDAAESEQAAAWMRAKGVNSHFIWRSGAERQLMASRFPLPEAQEHVVDQTEVNQVLQTWEHSHTDSR